jgi:hypothetical protein
MSRFNIGEKIIAIHYRIKDHRSFFNPIFCPWDDTLTKLDLAVLTVTEHHKVAWDQDPTGKREYDGFLLQDQTGQQWSNQYPHASYGQVSDAADRMFDRRYPDDIDFNTLSDEQMSTFEDARTVIDRVKRGIDHLVVIDPAKSELLRVHLDWLIKKLNKETGVTVVFEPVWKEHPDIVHAVYKWES